MQPPPTGHIVNIVVASVSLVQCMGLGQRLGATAHKKACRLAAGRGSLDVLKLFREQGCPWDKFTSARLRGRGRCPSVFVQRKQQSSAIGSLIFT